MLRPLSICTHVVLSNPLPFYHLIALILHLPQLPYLTGCDDAAPSSYVPRAASSFVLTSSGSA